MVSDYQTIRPCLWVIVEQEDRWALLSLAQTKTALLKCRRERTAYSSLLSQWFVR